MLAGVLLICLGVVADWLWLALVGIVPLILAPWGLAAPAVRRGAFAARRGLAHL